MHEVRNDETLASPTSVDRRSNDPKCHYPRSYCTEGWPNDQIK
jgi:hypothetical protein